jgi:hypothetical protein
LPLSSVLTTIITIFCVSAGNLKRQYIMFFEKGNFEELYTDSELFLTVKTIKGLEKLICQNISFQSLFAQQ